MDVMTFVPIVEVLANVPDIADVAQTPRGAHPECTTNHCIMSAQKSYNSFLLTVTASPGSVIRVWIVAMQGEPKNAMSIAGLEVHDKEAQALITAEEAGCSSFKFIIVNNLI